MIAQWQEVMGHCTVAGSEGDYTVAGSDGGLHSGRKWWGIVQWQWWGIVQWQEVMGDCTVAGSDGG